MFGWQNGISYISKKGDSAEIGFCKALKYKGIDGALLLQGGGKQRDGEIAKEVAQPLILQ